MERVVGRQGPHVDNDLRKSGRKLRISRRVYAGSGEQSDAEKSYLHKQWDHRYAHKSQQYDSICDVAQFAGQRDCRIDEEVEFYSIVYPSIPHIRSHEGYDFIRQRRRVVAF